MHRDRKRVGHFDHICTYTFSHLESPFFIYAIHKHLLSTYYVSSLLSVAGLRKYNKMGRIMSKKLGVKCMTKIYLEDKLF